MKAPDRLDLIALPALLRAARARYGDAIRAALARIDCEDMPRGGVYVIGAIARSGASVGQIIAELGISKQAACVLIDALVLRRYVERADDPADRRRLTLTLTERGRAAAAAARAAIRRLDADLAARVGEDRVMHTRATLLALIDLADGR